MSEKFPATSDIKKREKTYLKPFRIFIIFIFFGALTWGAAFWIKGSFIGLEDTRAEERMEVLEEITERDEAILSSYGVVNKKKKIYRIPIQKAMERVLSELEKPRKTSVRVGSQGTLTDQAVPSEAVIKKTTEKTSSSFASVNNGLPSQQSASKTLKK